MGVGDVHIDLWSGESQIYVRSAVCGKLISIGCALVKCSYSGYRLDWETPLLLK